MLVVIFVLLVRGSLTEDGGVVKYYIFLYLGDVLCGKSWDDKSVRQKDMKIYLIMILRETLKTGEKEVWNLIL